MASRCWSLSTDALLHFVKNVVIKVPTFTDLTANIKVAEFFPSFYDSNAELAVRVDPWLLLLTDWAYLEGFSHFLHLVVSVSHPDVLFLLFFNSSQDAAFLLACHFMCHSERPLTDLLNHIEVFPKSVTLLHSDGSDLLGSWV